MKKAAKSLLNEKGLNVFSGAKKLTGNEMKKISGGASACSSNAQCVDSCQAMGYRSGTCIGGRCTCSN